MAGIRERVEVQSERLLFETEWDALAPADPRETRPALPRAGEFSPKPAPRAGIRRFARANLSRNLLQVALVIEWERGAGFLLLPVMLSIGALL